jgi:hypothetical protein
LRLDEDEFDWNLSDEEPVPESSGVISSEEEFILSRQNLEQILNESEAEIETRVLRWMRGESLTNQEPVSSNSFLQPHTFQPPLPYDAVEGVPATGESLLELFLGVQCGTILEIIRNSFLPVNLYRLLPAEREKSDSRRVIEVGLGLSISQVEGEGKEESYRDLHKFFKAWVTYTGILPMLVPEGIQGRLSVALAIYTTNLYELLKRYPFEGVWSYQFTFYCKRVAKEKLVFQLELWTHFDSNLMVSKCLPSLK